ncbi:MAG: HigA family addiction module antidote protein [Proteobacteria bacterium]|nr:HigA family addiction module antidote protein [Pseudomonadota bacterium]
MLTNIERKPTSPAEMIHEYVIDEYGLTQGQLAEALKVTRQTISRLLNEHSRISPEMAFRIGTLTGTSPELWLNCQLAYDLWATKQSFGEQVKSEVLSLV